MIMGSDDPEDYKWKSTQEIIQNIQQKMNYYIILVIQQLKMEKNKNFMEHTNDVTCLDAWKHQQQVDRWDQNHKYLYGIQDLLIEEYQQLERKLTSVDNCYIKYDQIKNKLQLQAWKKLILLLMITMYQEQNVRSLKGIYSYGEWQNSYGHSKCSQRTYYYNSFLNKKIMILARFKDDQID